MYDKWWRRYNEYAEVRNVDIKDITNFHELNVLYEANGWLVDFDKNFMDHMLVKDIIKKYTRNPRQNKYQSLLRN